MRISTLMFLTQFILSCSTLPSSTNNPMDGVWEKVAATCEGGKHDAWTKAALGEPTRMHLTRMEISGSSVITTVTGQSSNECGIVSHETWNITDDTYLVVKAAARQTGRDEICNQPVRSSITGVAHRYVRNNNELKIFLDFPKRQSQPGVHSRGHIVCENGTLVSTYRRLNQ